MKFDKLTIYQPGLLLCDREERRLGEKVAQCMAKPLFGAFGASAGAIPCEMVAQGYFFLILKIETFLFQNFEIFKTTF